MIHKNQSLASSEILPKRSLKFMKEYQKTNKLNLNKTRYLASCKSQRLDILIKCLSDKITYFG